MKYLIIVGDGMADEPLAKLNGRTPLQAAKKPAIDKLAKNGRLGLVKTIPEGMSKGSEVANLSLMGYDPRKYLCGRGPLEAANMGLELGRDDVAFRCNLITEKKGILVDYSAGHIKTEDARILIELIGKKLGGNGIRFYPGVSYRHLLILKDYSEKVKCNPPHDFCGKKIEKLLPGAETKEGQRTAELLKELIKKSRPILESVEYNRNNGNRANMIWPWGQGKKPDLPRMKERYGIDGGVISAVDLVNGIGKYAGLSVEKVEGATGYFDTNYGGKAEKALDVLEKKDFVYLHVEAPDEAGHEGNLKEKIRAIENIDKKIVKKIIKEIGGPYRIIVTADHPTPIRVRTHTGEPVPFLLSGDGVTGEGLAYDEFSAAEGTLGIRKGEELLPLLIGRGGIP